jgi:hypothetical protein
MEYDCRPTLQGRLRFLFWLGGRTPTDRFAALSLAFNAERPLG